MHLTSQNADALMRSGARARILLLSLLLLNQLLYCSNKSQFEATGWAKK